MTAHAGVETKTKPRPAQLLLRFAPKNEQAATARSIERFQIQLTTSIGTFRAAIGTG